MSGSDGTMMSGLSAGGGGGVLQMPSSSSLSHQQHHSQQQQQQQHSHSVVQSMRLSFSADGTPIYKPLTTANNAMNIANAFTTGDRDTNHHGLNINMTAAPPAAAAGDSMKRKRGRPRKYGPDGSMSLALSPVVPSQTPPNTFSPPTPATTVRPTPPPAAPPSPTSFKKGRGRPPGSGKKHHVEPLGSVGVGFVPHVITVKAGEDVSSKIMSFSQHGPRAVCILTANGAISNVTLRQPATSGGTVTYEGRFEILSLSGSFMLNENGGQKSRSGGLSVSLSGPDGRVLGGGVAGILTAATPVQVIVGSFVADGRKESKQQMEEETTMGGGETNSRSESSGGGSPLNESAAAGGGCNNNNIQSQSMMRWK